MNNLPAMSRRQFLQTTAFASSAAALTGFAAENYAPPIAVFSKIYQSLKLDFDQAAALTAEAGLNGVDCPVRTGGEITPERARDDMPRYAEALRKQGVAMLLLTTGITSVDSAHAEAILRTAKQLGLHYYRLGITYHSPDKPAAKLVAEIRAQLTDLAALNKQLGVTAVFQNHSPSPHTFAGGELGELYDIVHEFAPDQIGVAFDLAHALIVNGDDWSRHFDRLAPHIKVAYVKDVKRPRSFVPFGAGEFSQTDYFSRLKRLGVTAPLSLHIEYDWTGPKQPPTRPALLTALQSSRRTLQQWLAAA